MTPNDPIRVSAIVLLAIGTIFLNRQVLGAEAKFSGDLPEKFKEVGNDRLTKERAGDTTSRTLTSDNSVKGRFEVQEGKTNFVTEKGVVVSVDKGAKNNPALGALDARVKVETAPDGSKKIKDFQIELFEDFKKAVAVLPDPAAKQKLKDKVEEVKADVVQAVNDRDPESTKKASEGLKGSRDELVAQFLALNEADRRRLAPLLGAAYLEAGKTRNRFDKGIYGFDDQYSPETYKVIYQRCDGVGRFLCGDIEQPRTVGTAFLVGKNLVLTAGHCLLDEAEDHIALELMHIRFEREAQQGGRETCTYPVSKVVLEGGAANIEGISVQKLDFALLELGADEQGRTADSVGLQPLALSNRLDKVQRDRAVYVVGYPNGGLKTVADYARVFVPYDNSNEIHGGFELEVEGEINARLQKAEQEKNPQQRALQRDFAKDLEARLRQRFQESFQRVNTGGTDRWFFVSSLLSDFKHPPQPAIAINADTFHGDSGAPVFTRGKSEVIGLFIRGAPDRGDLKISWEDHEEAIPIHFILDYWKQQHQNELAQYNVALR